MNDPPYPDVPFVSSIPVSQDVMREAACWTKMRARINMRDDLANVGAKRALDDFAKVIQPGREKYVDCSCSPHGNFVSLVYAEVLPERIALVAYLTEMGLLHDDYTEPEKVGSVADDHRRLDYALDPNITDSPDGLPKSLLMKKIYSKYVLDCLEIDLLGGYDMITQNSARWLRNVDKRPIPSSSTIEQYLDIRITDSGVNVFFWQIAFGNGIRLTDIEFNMMQPLFRPTAGTLLLINDLNSWNRERSQPQDSIKSAVLLFMNRGMTEREALFELKQLILDREALFLKERARFCQKHPDLPLHLKLMVNILEPAYGSYHLWCTRCPRYNADQDSYMFTKSSGLSSKNGLPITNGAMYTPRPTLHKRLQAMEKISYVKKTETSSLDQSALEAPLHYIRSLGSKNVRVQLIDSFNLWFEIPSATLDIIKQVVNDLHNSSLILDDIHDGSLLRRGSTATHVVFGEARSINSATYMFVQATKHIHNIKKPALITVLLDELQKLFIGQSCELKWRSTMHCPTEEEYFQMVDHKTGAMFRMLLHLMLATLEDDEDASQSTVFDQLACLMGRFYQVRDDYLNLHDADYADKKGFCEDLDEGKLSYPVILCCTDTTCKDIVLGILHRKGLATSTDLPVESKLQVLKLMEKAGVTKKTWDLVKDLQLEVEEEVRRLETTLEEENPILILLIKILGNIPEPGKRL